MSENKLNEPWTKEEVKELALEIAKRIGGRK